MPRSGGAWRRDLQSGTAFAALFAIGVASWAPAAEAQPVLPNGATVTHGDASISQPNASSLLIDQTSGSAIINWNSFSIGAGGITHFSNGSGATLNRVTGNLPSQIDGSLTATASLYLINPAGMVVGTGGMIATGGSFHASTQNVTDDDFLNGGDAVFSGNSKAQIINHGTISSAMGDVALIARRVENTGDISAPNGTAALLAGYDILMHETAGPNGKFVVRAGGSDTEVVNSGTINAAEVELRANGGNVLALAGNTKGVVKATGVSLRGGRIFLTAGGGKVRAGGRVTARRAASGGSQAGGDVFINADTVVATGHIDVSGLGAAGGNIDIGGRDIALQGATLDASGATGGGNIRVGGAYQGGDFGWLTTAQTASVDENTLITASATELGNGGEVIVWSNGATSFNGTILARGGANGGDGGFVETSGKQQLGVGHTAYVDALAPRGAVGDWLLDPENIEIVDGGQTTLAGADNAGTAGNLQIDADPINNAAANVTLAASNNITFNEAVSIANAGVGLTADAGGEVRVNTSITTNSGDITFLTNDPEIGAAVDAGTGTISFNLKSSAIFGVGAEVGTGVGLTVGELQNLSGGTLQIGDADSTNNNVSGIALFNTIDLSADFALVRYNSLFDGDSEVSVGGGISHTYAALDVFANRGLISIGDATITTTTGDIRIFGDEDGSNSGFGLRTQGIFGLVSAGDIFVNANNYSESSAAAELSLTANGGAGTIEFSRGGAGSIGVGSGSSGGMHFSDGELSRMSAAAINFGDATNTTAINVDGADFSGLGAFGFTTTAGGTVSFEDGTENYVFDSITVNAGTANLGAEITTTGGQTYNASTTLVANTTISETAGDVTFGSSIDGAFDLTVNTTGETTFSGAVGGTTLLSSLTTNTGGTTFVNGGLVATTGSQTFNDQVGVAGTVFAATGAGSDLNFNAGVTTTLPNNAVWFLAADDINVGGNIQWDGLGDVTLVAGWNAATDGSTGWTLGGTTADTSILDDAGNFGLGDGDINIGDGNQTAGVAVGSSGGVTTALARNLNLAASGANNGFAQLGFRGTGTQSIDVSLLGDITAHGGAGYAAYVQLGHGGFGAASGSGSITVSAGGDISFQGGDAAYSFAHLGHGGIAGGASSGNISVVANNVSFGAGGGELAWAQLGNGASNLAFDHSGNIDLTAAGDVMFSGNGLRSYALLGNGGINADGDHSGEIVAEVSGNLSLAGGAGGFSFAQVGHGGSADMSSGTRMGNISAVIGGTTAFDAGTGGYWFGHATTTGGGVSNANVALVTNGLSFAGLTTAGPTAASGDFADMIRSNLTGGNVLIANRLAQIGDADRDNPDFLDDIIFFGQGNDGSFATDKSLTFAATGEVSFEETLQIEGSGNINLAAGWDGTTGLDLTGFPMLSMADIEAAGAFGATSGAAGDNGDINIREFNPVSRIYVGTWMGDIHALAHDLEVKGGPADNSRSRLGARPQAQVDVDSNIRVVVQDDVIVTGGDGDGSRAAIGHTFGDGGGNISGDITIIGDTVSNSNEVVVTGGDGDNAQAQIGHEAFDGAAGGSISITSEDVNVGFDRGRFAGGETSFSQIGHRSLDFLAGATGNITVNASVNVVVVGGDALGTRSSIGHVGTIASGNVSVTTGNDMFVDGGEAGIADAQVGHTAAASSGDIDVNVGDDLFVRGSFDKDLAPARIGHFGTGDLTGDIDIEIAERFDLLGGMGDFSFAQIGHGVEAFPGAREGNISVVAGEEATIEDGTGTGSLAWIGHQTSDAGGVTNANVFLQAFGFDRDSGSTVAAGGLGRFNKDILEADIVGGNFTLIATGTGLLVEDPVYNSPFQLLMSVSNDMVLDTNATFVNSGTGDIILAAGGDFHNDTGSLTPFTTGGRWLVYSTRPDNNRNDIEITNWDFLRYATTFDINNPLVGSGDGLIYSVAPVVNFKVSDVSIAYGNPFAPTISQTLTVNGVLADANAFGLGINPATAQAALAGFVSVDGGGNPAVGSYIDGLITTNETVPYFGMSFTTDPGDLTVTDDTNTPGTTFTPSGTSGIGEMCAFRSDDEDPDEEGPAFDRIIELCGIIESASAD
jgi:filamentous hemagglutinin family protein